MKIKELVVTISKTTQISQYEPLVVSATETYTMDADDDLRECRAKAVKSLGESVRKSMISLENKFKEDEDNAS